MTYPYGTEGGPAKPVEIVNSSPISVIGTLTGGGGGGGASTIADGADVAQGTTTDTGVTTDTSGTVIGFLRGLVKLIIAKLGVKVASGDIASGAIASGAIASGALASGSVASGAMVDLGAIADAAVDGDATGTVNAHLRGISKKLSGSVAVTGSFYPAEEPVSVASGKIASGAVAAGAIATGAIVDLGTTITDAASTSTVEDTTAKTGIGLFKGIKNLLKLINDKLVTGTIIGDVNVRAITAGETHVGEIGGNTFVIDVPVVMTSHAGYAANDFVGVDATALIFANAARKNLGSGMVIGAVLIDYALQSVAGELWLFDTAPAGLPADSAAFTLTDAYTCIGVIPFNTYFTNALNSVSVGAIPNGQLPFVSNGTSLWGAFKTLGAPAYASSDLHIRLTVSRD
jgi:hypothetical protein